MFCSLWCGARRLTIEDCEYESSKSSIIFSNSAVEINHTETQTERNKHLSLSLCLLARCIRIVDGGRYVFSIHWALRPISVTQQCGSEQLAALGKMPLNIHEFFPPSPPSTFACLVPVLSGSQRHCTESVGDWMCSQGKGKLRHRARLSECDNIVPNLVIAITRAAAQQQKCSQFAYIIIERLRTPGATRDCSIHTTYRKKTVFLRWFICIRYTLLSLLNMHWKWFFGSEAFHLSFYSFLKKIIKNGVDVSWYTRFQYQDRYRKIKKLYCAKLPSRKVAGLSNIYSNKAFLYNMNL